MYTHYTFIGSTNKFVSNNQKESIEREWAREREGERQIILGGPMSADYVFFVRNSESLSANEYNYTCKKVEKF